MAADHELDPAGPSPPVADGPLRGDPTRAQVRGSTLLLLGQACALCINLVIQIVIVRVLSKADYGTFAYALSLVMLAETAAGLGLRRSVSRFVPIYEERGEQDKAAGTLLFAFTTVLLLGLATVLLVIGLRNVLAGSFPDSAQAAAVLVVLSALGPVNALSALLDGVFAIYVRPRAIVLRKFLLTPLMRLTVVAVLAFGSSSVVLLAAGYVLTGVAGLALYGAMLVPLVRRHPARREPPGHRLSVPAREVLGFTLPMLTTDISRALMSAGVAVILGILATAGDVAELRAVVPVSLAMTYVLNSFGTLFVPLAARLHARDEHEQLNRLYWQTAVWTAVFSYPLFIVMAGLAGPLCVLLFGERYEDAAPLLAILAVGHFATAAAGPNSVVLGVLGRVRRLVVINTAAGATSLALALLLIPPLDALGAAIAISAALVLLNVALQVGLRPERAVSALDPGYIGLYAVLAGVTAAALPLLWLAPLPPWADAVVAALAAATVLGLGRRRLDVGETFPELARVPVLGVLVPTEGPRR